MDRASMDRASMDRAAASRLSPATEDYLKALYKLGPGASATGGAGARVATKALADALGVAAASVTDMVKRLGARGLVDYAPYRGAVLTDAGRRVALEVLRHHRLLELYLKEVMDYSWAELHAEAEHLEHHISEAFESKLDELLGYPTRDPHGHPIPTREGAVEDVATDSLADLGAGRPALICHLADDDPALLQHLEDRGLMPGVRLRVTRAEAFDGPLTVRVGGPDGPEQRVGHAVAQSVFVRSLG